MNGRQAYEIWTDNNARWTQWTRPVAFVACNNTKIDKTSSLILPNISYADLLNSNTAVVLDLPDSQSIEEGLALAKLNVRPVALFNGTNAPQGALSTVFNSNIENSLLLGAEVLQNIKLTADAPPAFLLDSNRLQRFKMNVSVFDNSWDIYMQDMPSAEYLLANKIETIIVRSEKIFRDLNIILFKYQQSGLKILHIDQSYEAVNIVVKKPSKKHLKLS